MSLASAVVKRLRDMYRRVLVAQRLDEAERASGHGALRRARAGGLEPLEGRLLLDAVSLTPAGGTLTIAVTDGLPHTIVLQDDAAPNNGFSRVVVDGTETHDFANPATALVLNAAAAGACNDTITLNALDGAFAAAVQINAGTGADTIRVNAFTGPGGVTVNGGAGGDSLVIDPQGAAIASNTTASSASGSVGFGSAATTVSYQDTEAIGVTNTDTNLPTGLSILPSDLRTALGHLATAGGNLAAFGDFNLVVPFTDKTFGELLDPQAVFQKLADDFQSQVVLDGSLNVRTDVTTFDVLVFLQSWNGAAAYADGSAVTVHFTGTPTATVDLLPGLNRVTFAGLSLTAQRTSTLELSMGLRAREMNLVIPGAVPDVDVTTTLSTGLDFGASEQSAPAPFYDLAGLQGQAAIGSPTQTLADFDLNVGVLGTTVSGATVHLAATVTGSVDPSTDMPITGSGTGTAVAILPIAVKPGFTVPGLPPSPTITLGSGSVDLFTLATFEYEKDATTTVDELVGPAVTMDHPLEAFTRVTAADLLAPVYQIADFLDIVGDSPNYNRALAFTGGLTLSDFFGTSDTLDASYGFGTVIRDSLAIPRQMVGAILSSGYTLGGAGDPDATLTLWVAQDSAVPGQAPRIVEVPVTIARAQLTGNASLGDLVADLRAAVRTALIAQGLAADAAGADALVTVAGVTDDDGNERLVLSSGHELRLTDPNATAGRMGLVTGQTNRQAGFATLQEMLAAAGAVFTGAYAADGTLAFTYNGSFVQTPYTTSFAFDQTFTGLSNVVVHADVQAGTGMDLQFVYGVDLTPAPSQARLVSSTQNRLPQSGVLSGPAHFTLTVTINSSPTAVHVTVAPDGGNAGVADLVADIQAAVDAAVVTAGGNAGDVVVGTDSEASGYRLTFTAPVSGVDATDPAATELGLGSPRGSIQTPVTGLYAPGEAIVFGLLLDEALPVVSVVVGAGGVGDLTDNASLDDLIDDLNAAISDALVDAGFAADLVSASADGDRRIALTLKSGAAQSLLRLVETDTGNTAILDAGFRGLQLDGTTHVGEFYVDQTATRVAGSAAVSLVDTNTIVGDVILPPTGRLDADATFGLGVGAVTHTVTVSQAATAANAGPADLAADVQAALDAAFGGGAVTAAVNGQGQLVLTSAQALSIPSANSTAVHMLGLANNHAVYNFLGIDLGKGTLSEGVEVSARINPALAVGGLVPLSKLVVRAATVMADTSLGGTYRLADGAAFQVVVGEGQPPTTVTIDPMAGNADLVGAGAVTLAGGLLGAPATFDLVVGGTTASVTLAAKDYSASGDPVEALLSDLRVAVRLALHAADLATDAVTVSLVPDPGSGSDLRFDSARTLSLVNANASAQTALGLAAMNSQITAEIALTGDMLDRFDALTGTKALPANGALAAAAQFTLGVQSIPFKVTVAAGSYGSRAALASAVNSALATAVAAAVSANPVLAGLSITAAADGSGRLVLTSNQTFQVDALNALAQSTLGLATTLPTYRLASDALFHLRVGAVEVDVTVEAALTSTNATPADLAQDVAAAVAAALVSHSLAPDLVSVSHDADNQLVFTSAAALTLSARDPHGLAADELGLQNALTPAGLAAAVNAALADAGLDQQLRALIVAVPDSADPTGTGFRVTLALDPLVSLDRTLTITAAAELGFTAGVSSVTVQTFTTRTGEEVSFGGPPILVAQTTPAGPATLDLPGLVAQTAEPFDLTVSLSDPLDAATAALTIATNVLPVADHLTFSDVRNLLMDAHDILLNIGRDVDLLHRPLPLIGMSAVDLNAVTTPLGDVLLQLSNGNAPATLQDLQAIVQQKLGTTAPIFAFDAVGSRLTVALTYEYGETHTAPFRVDLAALSEGQTLPYPGLITPKALTSGNATVRYNAASRATPAFNLALDYSAVSSSDDLPVSQIDPSSTLSIEVRSLTNGVVTKAFYGPGSLTIDSGSVRLGDTAPLVYTVAFAAPGGGPVTVDSVLEGDLSTLLHSTLSGDAVVRLDLSTSSNPDFGPLSIALATPPDNTAGTFETTFNAIDCVAFNDLLTGNTVSTLLRNPDVFVSGIGGMVNDIETTVELVLEPFTEVPLLGDKVIQPVLDWVEDMRRASDSFFDQLASDVKDMNLDLVEAIRNGLFSAFGTDGLGVLLDSPTGLSKSAIDSMNALFLSGLVINNQDVVVTEGDPGNDVLTINGIDQGPIPDAYQPLDSFVQWDLRLGQSITISLPFTLGFTLQDIAGVGSSLPGFGLKVSDAGTGVQLKFAWTFDFGFGISTARGFYLNTDAKAPDGTDTPEANFTFEASTPGLEATLALGLVQGHFVDGTVTPVRVTAGESIIAPADNPDNLIDLSVLATQPHAGDFIIRAYNAAGSHTDYHLDYHSVGDINFLEFMLEMNLSLAAIGAPLAASANLSDPLHPRLVLSSNDATIVAMDILAADPGKRLGFADGQTDDLRSVGMGFANGQASAADVATGLQALTGLFHAPTEGVPTDTSFTLNVGGVLVPVVITASLHTDAASADDDRALLQQRIDTVLGERGNNVQTFTAPRAVDASFTLAADALLSLWAGDALQDVVIPAGAYTPDSLLAAIQGRLAAPLTAALDDAGRLVFTSSDTAARVGVALADTAVVAHMGLPASTKTVSVRVDADGNMVFYSPYAMSIADLDTKEHTRARIAFGLDLEDDGGEVSLSPTLNADAQLRFNVDGNTDHLTEPLEAAFGAAKGSLSLPSLNFDFKINFSLPSLTDLGKFGAGAAQHAHDPANKPKPSKAGLFIDKIRFDNVVLDVGALLDNVVKPVGEMIHTALGPVIHLLGDGTDEAEAFLTRDLPLLDDLGIHVSLLDILDKMGVGTGIRLLFNTVKAVEALDQTVAALADTGTINLGCWELVQFKYPVPCAVADSISTLGLPSGLTGNYVDVNVDPGGFKLDILSINSILNWMLGKPFDIFSFNLPTIDVKTGLSIPFGIDIGDFSLGFNISLSTSLHEDMGLVYDSSGLQRLNQAYNAGAEPDYLNLLDGFYIRNEVGPELSMGLDFSGRGGVGPIELDLLVTTVTLFDAHASVYAGISAGLDLKDPNEDGKLRLNEIFELTNDFADPQNLIWLFDAVLRVYGGFGFSVTLLDVTLDSDDLGIPTNFDFTVSLQDLFGLAGLTPPAPQSHLADVTTMNGVKVLRLNTGPFDYARIYGDTDDSNGPVVYRVTGSEHTALTITCGSSTQTLTAADLAGVTGIVGYGTNYGDTFDFSGMNSLDLFLVGSDGDDVLAGGAGNDTIDGGLGNDTLSGLGGNDTLTGGDGDDTLYGDAGDDSLNGGPGDDQLYGGADDDTYLFNPGWGDDTIHENDGEGFNDAIDMSGVHRPVTAVLDVHGTRVSDGTNSVTVAGAFGTGGHNVEAIQTGGGNDQFLVSASNQAAGEVTRLDGGNGNDTYRVFLGDPRSLAIGGLVAAEGAFDPDGLNAGDVATFWIRVEDSGAIRVDVTRASGATTLLQDINAALASALPASGDPGVAGIAVTAQLVDGKLQFAADGNQLLAVYSQKPADLPDPTLGTQAALATSALGIAAIEQGLLLGDLSLFDSGYAYNTDRILVDGSQEADQVGLNDRAITARRVSQPESDTKTINYNGTEVVSDAASVAQNGQLSADAVFTVQLGTHADVTVAVSQADTAANASVADLAADAQAALNAALAAAGISDTITVTAVAVDGTSNLALKFASNNPAAGLLILADAADPAYTQMGLGRAPAGNGVEVMEFRLRGGDDVANVESTPATASVLFQGAVGDDTFNVGVFQANPEHAHAASVLTGPLGTGGANGGQLTAPGAFVLEIDTLAQLPVLVPANAAAATYDDLAADVQAAVAAALAAAGADFAGVAVSVSHVLGADGVDRLWFTATRDGGSADLALYAAQGDAAVGQLALPMASDLNAMAGNDQNGPLRIEGGAGSDVFNAFDTRDTAANSGWIDTEGLRGLGMAQGVDFTGLEGVNVFLGQGGDVFNVTANDVPLAIYTRPGDDVVNISSTLLLNSILPDGRLVPGATNILNGGPVDTTGAGAVQTGQLSRDAVLYFHVGGVSPQTVQVTVAKTATDANATLADLASDVQAAFAAAMGGVYVTVTAFTDTDGIDRLEFRSIIDESSIYAPAQYLDGESALVDNPASTELGLVDRGLLDNIQAALLVVGGAGDNTLNASDAGETDSNLGALTQTLLTGLGMSPAGIEYHGQAFLNIDLGDGDDLFNVRGTLAATALNAGIGDDVIYVSSGADLSVLQPGPGRYTPPASGSDLADLNAQALHPAGSSLDEIAGDIDIDAGPGQNTLGISDRYDATGDTAVITGMAVTGLSDGDIGYRADGGDFSGQGYWSLTGDIGLFGRGITVYGGTGGNTIAVTGLYAAPLATPFARNITTLFTGEAGDTVTVGVADSPNAMLVVQGQAGDDSIDASASSLPMILLGDAGEDTLTGGTGNDWLLGDGGRAYFLRPAAFSAGGAFDIVLGGAYAAAHLAGVTADSAFLTPELVLGVSAPATDGADSVSGGPGDDFILGGNNGDGSVPEILSGGAGDDVVLGDNGRFDYGLASDTIAGRPDVTGITFVPAPGTLDRIMTTNPLDGEGDTIHGDAGNDILLGGTAGDTITGDTSDTPAPGDGSDIVLGDSAKVYPSLPWAASYFAIDTGTASGAGDDTLYGNGGDDFLLGQQGGDTLYGGAGEDDLTGGSNVIGASDGDDTMYGGADADVMLGDNGVIARQPVEGQSLPWQRWPAPFADVIRQVTRYDDVDGVGGDDTMYGDGGADIQYGQRGDDRMHGGAGNDELVGNLGDDHLWGDEDADFMLGDQGYFLRVLNDDASPRTNADGTFHRDAVLEDVGSITGSIPLDTTALRTFDPLLAAKIVGADLNLLSGVYSADGSPHRMPDTGAWQTEDLLIDLVAANGDTMYGGDGNDFLVGQRGDDSLAGDAGNDTLIGDLATNVTAARTDMPQVLQTLRLIGADESVGIDLGVFGTVVTPTATLYPEELSCSTLSAITSLTPAAPGLTDVAAGSSLARPDGRTQTPLVAVIPDVVHHADVLPGNDEVSGGAGNDLVVGDNAVVFSPAMTGMTVLDKDVADVNGQLLDVARALHELSLNYDLYEHRAAAVSHIRDITVAADTLDGGSGNDTVYGDTMFLSAPFAAGVPVAAAADFTAAALDFQRQLGSLRTLAVDFGFVVQEGRLQVLNALAADALAANPGKVRPKATDVHDPVYHVLHLASDTISGGSGSDSLYGDNAVLLAPVVTGESYQQPATYLALTRQQLAATQKALTARQRLDDKGLADHVRNDHATAKDFKSRLAASADLSLAPFAYEPARYVGNDTITGGDGDKLIEADIAIVTTPILKATPATPRELAQARRDTQAVLGSVGKWLTAATDWRPAKKYFQKTRAQVGDRRVAGADPIVLSLANDTIVGGTGRNLIMGGGLYLVAPFDAAAPAQWIDLGAVSLGSDNMQNNRHDCLGADLGGQKVTRQFAADGIDVSASSDNTVFGGGPDNQVIPGPGVNRIRTNSGTAPDRAAAVAMQQFIVGSLAPALERHWLNLADAGSARADGLFLDLIV